MYSKSIHNENILSNVCNYNTMSQIYKKKCIFIFVIKYTDITICLHIFIMNIF